MKKMRRFAAIAAAAAMTACMAMPMASMFTASAASITIDTTGTNTAVTHTYEAYQIFTGSLDANNKLTVEDWGSGVNGTNLLAALKNNPIDGLDFSTCTNAGSVAQVLAGVGDKSAEAEALAELISKHLTTKCTTVGATATTVDAGYYLIKDKDNTISAQDAYTSYILKVTDNEVVTLKSAYPTVEKKVKEEDFNNTEAATAYGDQDYNDVADYDIGDNVPFALYGTLPTNYADYTTYKYTFHDTLDSTLAYDANSAKVYVVNKNGDNYDFATKVEVTGSFSITENSGALTVHCDNLKGITAATISSTSKIMVEYTATLATNAVIGRVGQENVVTLEFSNNPNYTGAGDTETDSTGTTPEDKVIVFTYELDVTKKDKATSALLPNAYFALARKNADNITEYVKVNSDGRVTGWTTTLPTETEGVWAEAEAVLKSDENGLFKVIGIDDGNYELVELKAPNGYNPLDAAVPVVITATTKNGQSSYTNATDALSSLKINVDNATTDTESTDANKGIVEATVVNSMGTTLPGTGGIGTTLFYVVGGTLAAGAGVALIAKKRMKNEE